MIILHLHESEIILRTRKVDRPAIFQGFRAIGTSLISGPANSLGDMTITRLLSNSHSISFSGQKVDEMGSS